MAGELRLNKSHAELPGQEKSLFPVRDLRRAHPNYHRAHAAFLANGHPILVLHESLRGCDAISAKRLNRLNDPDCQFELSDQALAFLLSYSRLVVWARKIDAQLTRYIHIAADAAYSATTENAED